MRKVQKFLESDRIEVEEEKEGIYSTYLSSDGMPGSFYNLHSQGDVKEKTEKTFIESLNIKVNLEFKPEWNVDYSDLEELLRKFSERKTLDNKYNIKSIT